MNAIEVLVEVDWFSSVGDILPNALAGVVSVSNWEEATSKCADPGWEDVCTQASNDLTTHLNIVCKSDFHEWNIVINDAKRQLAESWSRLRAYLNERGLPRVIGDCAEWDTMHAVAAEHFAKWNPPRFYGRLLTVYQYGRFPCGWDGKWPDGRPCVF